MTDPGLISFQAVEAPDWYERQYRDGGWPDEENDDEDDT